MTGAPHVTGRRRALGITIATTTNTFLQKGRGSLSTHANAAAPPPLPSGGGHLVRQLDTDIWSIEGQWHLGVVQTPLRSVVIRTSPENIFMYNVVEPTEELMELFGQLQPARLDVLLATDALEHRFFPWCSALERQSSQLIDTVQFWTLDDLARLKKNGKQPQLPWQGGIETTLLDLGRVGGAPVREAACFHRKSGSLMVTDQCIFIEAKGKAETEDKRGGHLGGVVLPEHGVMDVDKLLDVSRTSTLDAIPLDSDDQRKIGWMKQVLLALYFTPEHEEFARDGSRSVYWTPGIEKNYDAIAGRLLTPPVLRELQYSSDTEGGRRRRHLLKEWVETISHAYTIKRVVPSHFGIRSPSSNAEFRNTFSFLEDDAVDPFPVEDLRTLGRLKQFLRVLNV